MVVETVDYHTAGEPFRIVPAGLPPIAGDTVAERRAIAIGAGGRPTEPRPSALDTVRRLLTREPRGHAGMYGGFLVPPDDDEAHLGVLFFHKDGYSTACGHGTIALGAWAVDSGLVAAPEDGRALVRIDVPSGRVAAVVHRTGGRTTAVTFRNVPTRVLERGVRLNGPRAGAPGAGGVGDGPVTVDLADAGAVYASMRVPEVSLRTLPELTALGRELRRELLDRYELYGVIFHQELDDGPAGPVQRNVTVFADGQIDRSPCGSGTSARLALLADEGALRTGQELRHESVIGSVFTGRVIGERDGAYLTEVTGLAHRTGEHRFVLHEQDELGTGFLL
ncbi:proline racemase family protein [Kitasatospora sp. RB6PN24]|uniref:proline racemase family protein n=1 Tax=Kitasatospora humi TaxID=2893891 RepID=UPI001E626471|nr:proline racemase family protein [Kitasatospora humi]MCC9307508.1 proline racemase family protein [Kitasatospora humi]